MRLVNDFGIPSVHPEHGPYVRAVKSDERLQGKASLKLVSVNHHKLCFQIVRQYLYDWSSAARPVRSCISRLYVIVTTIVMVEVPETCTIGASSDNTIERTPTGSALLCCAFCEERAQLLHDRDRVVLLSAAQRS